MERLGSGYSRTSTNPHLTGLLIDVEDLDAFQTFMASPEADSAKVGDGVKSDTMKILREVTL